MLSCPEISSLTSTKLGEGEDDSDMAGDDLEIAGNNLDTVIDWFTCGDGDFSAAKDDCF